MGSKSAAEPRLWLQHTYNGRACGIPVERSGLACRPLELSLLLTHFRASEPFTMKESPWHPKYLPGPTETRQACFPGRITGGEIKSCSQKKCELSSSNHLCFHSRALRFGHIGRSVAGGLPLPISKGGNPKLSSSRGRKTFLLLFLFCCFMCF